MKSSFTGRIKQPHEAVMLKKGWLLILNMVCCTCNLHQLRVGIGSQRKSAAAVPQQQKFCLLLCPLLLLLPYFLTNHTKHLTSCNSHFKKFSAWKFFLAKCLCVGLYHVWRIPATYPVHSGKKKTNNEICWWRCTVWSTGVSSGLSY